MTHTLAASAAHDQLAACDRDEIERQLSAMLRAIGEPCTLTPGQLGMAAGWSVPRRRPGTGRSHDGA